MVGRTERDRQAGRVEGIEADRQAGTQVGRETGRQADREADRQSVFGLVGAHPGRRRHTVRIWFGRGTFR